MPSIPAFAPSLSLRRFNPINPSISASISPSAPSIPRAQLSLSHPLRSIPALSTHRFAPPNGIDFSTYASQLVDTSTIPNSVADNLLEWYASYRQAVVDNPTVNQPPTIYTEEMFCTLLELARQAIVNPIPFQSYHQRIRSPFDYYKFGHDFASVLLNVDDSQVLGKENAIEAMKYVQQGHNVVFFSNHQSEGDPYAIDFLLKWVAGCDKQFCEEIIFMAGDRVRNDPVVSPFSAGRNLLTVYSKKHLNDEPHLRDQKLRHNRQTIAETHKLFRKGGKVIWFAPSGGRDRRSDSTKSVEISPMDQSAIDMMRITAKKSTTITHFYPMSLWTYDMLPPPSGVGGKEVGEPRRVSYTPMDMCVGEELHWHGPGAKQEAKEDRRRRQREELEEVVRQGYQRIGGYDR